MSFSHAENIIDIDVQKKRKRNELYIPFNSYTCIDQWIGVLGDKVYLELCKLHTMATRTKESNVGRITYGIKGLARIRGIASNTMRKYLNIMYDYGLVDFVKSNEHTTGTPKTVVIIQNYPLGDYELRNKPLVKVRNHKELNVKHRKSGIEGAKKSLITRLKNAVSPIDKIRELMRKNGITIEDLAEAEGFKIPGVQKEVQSEAPPEKPSDTNTSVEIGGSNELSDQVQRIESLLISILTFHTYNGNTLYNNHHDKAPITEYEYNQEIEPKKKHDDEEILNVLQTNLSYQNIYQVMSNNGFTEGQILQALNKLYKVYRHTEISNLVVQQTLIDYKKYKYKNAVSSPGSCFARFIDNEIGNQKTNQIAKDELEPKVETPYTGKIPFHNWLENKPNAEAVEVVKEYPGDICNRLVKDLSFTKDEAYSTVKTLVKKGINLYPHDLNGIIADFLANSLRSIRTKFDNVTEFVRVAMSFGDTSEVF